MTVKDLIRTASASVILVPTTNENRRYEWSEDNQSFEFVQYGFDAEYDDLGQLRIYETKEIVKLSDIEDKEVTSVFCQEYTSISFHIKDDFKVEEEKLLVSYINATDAAKKYESIPSISFKEEMDFRVKDIDKLSKYFPDEDKLYYFAEINGVSSTLFVPIFEIEEKKDYYLIKDTSMTLYNEFANILPGKVSKENFGEHKVKSAVADPVKSAISVLIEISKDEITPIPKEDINTTATKPDYSELLSTPVTLKTVKTLYPDVKLFKYADDRKKNTDDLRYEYLWDERTKTYRTDPNKMLTCHIDLEDNVHIISNSYVAIMGDNTIVDKLTPSGTGIRAWTKEGLITTVDEVEVEKYVTREIELDDDFYFKERSILLEHFENIFGYEVLMSVEVDEKASILSDNIKSTKFKYDSDKEINYFETKDGGRLYFDIDDCIITKIRLDGYYSGDVSLHAWIEVDITDLEEWVDNTTKH